MPMIRVLIVAPYAAVRAGLHALLSEAEGCEVIGAVSGSAELEQLLPEARPGVVLLSDDDTGGPLPGDGARVVEMLSGEEIGLVVLGSEARAEPGLAEAALPGWAYLLKDADAEEIAAAVRAVAAGLVVLDRRLAPPNYRLQIADRRLERQVTPPDNLQSPIPNPQSPPLTARERDVLQLMAEGLQNRQIAERLYLSPHTVKFHVASILAKLGATSRTEAVTLAARRGDLIL